MRRDKYCTLIVVSPRHSIATYLDLGSPPAKKNYSIIKSVLDEAIEVYANKGCSFAKKGELFVEGKHVMKHVFEFPCVKQPQGSTKEAFYALHHLKGFVRVCQNLTVPSSLGG